MKTTCIIRGIILSLVVTTTVSTTVANQTDTARCPCINGSCAMQLQDLFSTICNDKNINVYLETSLATNPPSTLQALGYTNMSNVWKYVTEKYGPFKPDNLLNIILQKKQTKMNNNTEEEDEEDDCINLHDSDKNCSMIKCNVSSLANSTSLIDKVTVQMGALALKLSTRTDTWPGHDMSDSSVVLSILVYDMYLGVGQVEKASQWKAVKLNESSSRVNDTKFCAPKAVFWFRDWYLKIYEGYGNSTLTNFFAILSEHWPTPTSNGNGNGRQLNAGEWVHFWSGASCANLIDLANISFGWNQGYQMQFNEAMKEFPEISSLYPCLKCDIVNARDKNEPSKGKVYPVVLGLVAFIIILTCIGFKICRVIMKNENKVKRRLAQRQNDLWISRGCGDIVSRYAKADDESAELQLLRLENLFLNNALGSETAANCETLRWE